MNILIANDDGCQAAGILALARSLRHLAHCTLVAPDRDRSGASNSLTLDVPLRARKLREGVFCVNGTPTDSVHLAITGLLQQEPDMVISGLNAGPNLGDDVIYSGTVAAAMEGRFLGYPAIAASMASYQPAHYETGGRVVAELVERLSRHPIDAGIVLNLNIPDVPYEQLRGVAITRLGHRHKAEPAVAAVDPRGNQVYWVGAPGPEQDAGPGTDFHAVNAGYASLTPLQVDMTRMQALGPLRDWLQGFQATAS